MAKGARVWSSVFVVLVAVGAQPGCVIYEEADPITRIDPVTVKVMTRNLYLGADLLPLFTAAAVEQIPERVAQLWGTIQRNDFPARARLLAAEIAAAAPDLVGLQEVEVFRIQRPSDFSFAAPVKNATEVAFDFLALLQGELAALGADYFVAAVFAGTDVELPALDPADGGTFDVRLTDRDVILAARRVQVSDPQSVPYLAYVPARIPAGTGAGVPARLVRGLGRVRAQIGQARFTFVNTHLEDADGPSSALVAIQEAQAQDLLRTIDSIVGPVLAVGDYNSPPIGASTRSYRELTAALRDTHTSLGLTEPAHTCCVDLQAPAFEPQERIDLILFRGPVRAQRLERVGDAPAARTPGGLWPSDHAGVIGTVTLDGI